MAHEQNNAGGKQAPRDQNFVPAALFEIEGSDPPAVTPGLIDELTGRILVEGAGGGDISTQMQTDVFVATSGQTTFTASANVAYTFGFYIQTLLTPPNSSGAQADYSVSGGVATLSNISYPNGVPGGTIVVWVYSIT
jgi:hypothetical protein